MNTILFTLWFYIPAGTANMAPIFAKKITILDSLNVPLDFGKSINNKRIFGDHKTIRGFFAGYFVALITVLAQVWLYENTSFFNELSPFNYSTMNVWLFAGIFSVGALGGDAVESFLKRQFNIPPGKSWPFFDQVDWILGAVLLSLFVTSFSASIYFLAIIWGLLLHPISTFIGWIFKLKDEPI